MSNLIHIHNRGVIQPIPEKLWFAMHQDLLLRMVETDYGRDLLLIPHDFEPIIKIEFNSVHGLLDGVNAKVKAQYFTSERSGNLIRHRWREFSAFAKDFYSHGGRTKIWVDGMWKTACTTETFYPVAGNAGTLPIDGFIPSGSQVDWDTARDATTGLADATSLFLNVFSEWLTAGYNIYRSFINVDTTTLPSVDSATWKLYGNNVSLNGYGDEVIHIVKSTQANPLQLVNDDFDNVIFSSVGSLAYAGQSNSAYNDFIVTDLTAINAGGITSNAGMMGRDLSDTAPTVINTRNAINYKSADNGGSSIDPYLEVIYTDAPNRQRFIGQRPILTVDKQIIGNRGNPIIR